MYGSISVYTYLYIIYMYSVHKTMVMYIIKKTYIIHIYIQYHIAIDIYYAV